MLKTGPNLALETSFFNAGASLVAGMDEVGRGSLAGPVSVGVTVLGPQPGDIPVGLADSKLLTPQRRTALVPHIQQWVRAWAVGHASAQEIDEIGIIGALHLAGARALAAAEKHCGAVDVVVLDGSHNWLVAGAATAQQPPPAAQIHVEVKADLKCASVAAASVLAKVERDAMMVELSTSHPQYQWDRNKGYASPKHVEALRSNGASMWHRRSWQLPGLTGERR